MICGDLEPNLATTEQEAGYTLERSPIWCRLTQKNRTTHSHLWAISFQIVGRGQSTRGEHSSQNQDLLALRHHHTSMLPYNCPITALRFKSTDNLHVFRMCVFILSEIISVHIRPSYIFCHIWVAWCIIYLLNARLILWLGVFWPSKTKYKTYQRYCYVCSIPPYLCLYNITE